MKVLLGTTNPSKVERFSCLLKDYDVEFLTLDDIDIKEEPEETGGSPEENAVIKATFYGKYLENVICSDSGLYFMGMELDDKRQPGLKIRTPMGRRRLSDDEMIEYYSGLIRSLGGRVSAYYLDGISVYHEGRIFSYMDIESAKETSTFEMIDVPSPKRFPGWPLDSLSIVKETGKYFVETKVNKSKENIIKVDYEKNIVKFLKSALEL